MIALRFEQQEARKHPQRFKLISQFKVFLRLSNFTSFTKILPQNLIHILRTYKNHRTIQHPNFPIEVLPCPYVPLLLAKQILLPLLSYSPKKGFFFGNFLAILRTDDFERTRWTSATKVSRCIVVLLLVDRIFVKDRPKPAVLCVYLLFR